jgi:hypothetical protein
VIEPIVAAQCAGLDRLLAQTPDPPVTELVAAFAGPLFDEMPAGDEGGDRTSRLIVTIIVDPAEEMRDWTGAATDRDLTTPRSGRYPCSSNAEGLPRVVGRLTSTGVTATTNVSR